METPFFGGSYTSLSSNAANDRVINLYPEFMETKQGKQVGVFYSTPGQRAILLLPNFGVGQVLGPLRGSHTMSTTNKMIHVYGNTVMTVDINNVTVFIGFINTATGPVSIVDNGFQFLVVDGFQAWVYANKAWTAITTLPGQPVTACIQDGFALVNIFGTAKFYQSNLNDMTVWDPLNFSSADAEPSPIIGMTTLFRQLWIFKQNSTEVWNNAGTAGFSFQRMQGVYLQVGCQAPFSISTSGDRVLWLGGNSFGSNSVYMNNGYEAQAVSTKAVDYQIFSYMKATQKGCIDAVAFVYSQAGHPFYVITFPGGNATWVYDLSTQLWHERGEWIGGVYIRWDPSTYCYYNKQHVVGSSTGQQLSALDLAYPVDDLPSNPVINPKKWMRRWRASQKAINEPIRFTSLRLDMQTGVGILPVSKSILAAITITGSLGNSYVGVPSTYAYTVFSKFQPYNCAISSGSLPPGLTLSSLGVISGTPTTSGVYSWSVSASDAYGNIAVDNDGASIFAITWWLTDGNTNRLWKNATLPNWSGSLATTRSPFIPLHTSLSSGGYLQFNDTNLVGCDSTGNIEHVRNIFQTGVVGTTVVAVDTSGDTTDNFYVFGSVIILCLQNQSYYQCSIDNGNTWFKVNSPSGYNMQSLGKTAAGVWFAEISSGASGGLYYSTDANYPVNWTFSGTGITSNTSGQVLAGNGLCMKTTRVGVVYTSTDGKSWSLSASGVYPGTNSNIGDVNPSTNTFIYSTNNTNSLVYITKNAGVTWSTVNTGSTGPCRGMRYYSLVNTWVGSFTDGMFYSTNDGSTWSPVVLPAGVTLSFALPVRHAP